MLPQIIEVYHIFLYIIQFLGPLVTSQCLTKKAAQVVIPNNFQIFGYASIEKFNEMEMTACKENHKSMLYVTLGCGLTFVSVLLVCMPVYSLELLECFPPGQHHLPAPYSPAFLDHHVRDSRKLLPHLRLRDL